MIPPEQNGDFVARMEQVLDVYKRPYDSRYPLICMDESPRQLIAETRQPIVGEPGTPVRYDYEYERRGVCNVFMAVEPLRGTRIVQLRERKTTQDWAYYLRDIAGAYGDAERMTLVIG